MIVNNPYNVNFIHKELDFLRNDQNIIVSSEIEEEGKYYVMIGSCDPGNEECGCIRYDYCCELLWSFAWSAIWFVSILTLDPVPLSPSPCYLVDPLLCIS